MIKYLFHCYLIEQSTVFKVFHTPPVAVQQSNLLVTTTGEGKIFSSFYLSFSSTFDW